MQVRRAALALAVVGSIVSVAFAGPESSQNASSNSSSRQVVSSLPEVLQRLSGDWDGSMQVRVRTGNQAAQGSFACRANNSGLLACFDGKADGKAVEGASFFFFNDKSNAVEAVSFNTISNSTFRGTQVESNKADTLVFRGHMTDSTGSRQTVEQTVTVQSNALTVAYFTIAQDGTRSRILQLDMNRAANGTQVSASNLLQKTSLSARVAPNTGQSQTAGVNEDGR